MRRFLASAAIIAVSLIAACSSDSDDDATATTAEPSTTLTTVAAATTTVKATTTAVTAPKFTSPEKASAHLFDAWRSGNRGAASQAANPAVVDELFSHPPNGPAPTFEGCQQQPGGFDCAYRYEGGGMIFRVEGSAAAGYRVVKLTYIAD